MTYSFIIPHHNSPELLNRCLDSIPKRDDIQIIVVDDNSKVEFRPNVKRSDVEVVYIDAEHTKGAGHARNVGIERAKGKWLIFADCDDYYSDGFIDVLDKYSNENMDVLYFNYNYLDGVDMSPIGDCKLQTLLDLTEKDKEQTIYIKYQNNTPWDKMILRELVLSNNIRYEEVENGNDVLFSLLIAQYSVNVKINTNRLYNYIKTPNSIGTKKQSISGLVCRVEHILKHNKYNNKIGHSEWNNSLLLFFCGILRQYGFVTFFKVLSTSIFRLVKGECKPKEWCNLQSY